MYPILPINADDAVALEQLGTKRKFWYLDDRERRCLFKAEERKTGEDWAEKVVCELAARLGIPHVHYELAVEEHSGIPGVMCENCARGSDVLVLGNQLLLILDSAYPAEVSQHYKVSEHTVEAVSHVVRGLLPPDAIWTPTLPDGVATALDVFIGYIMLDALTANQDRHHENWGAILSNKRLLLAPTFDHGAALARNLTDAEREERMTTRDHNRQIPQFADRARSAIYHDAGARRPMSTFETWETFATLAPSGARSWLNALQALHEHEIAGILDQVPESRMSPVCRQFTLALLQNNRARLLAT